MILMVNSIIFYFLINIYNLIKVIKSTNKNIVFYHIFLSLLSIVFTIVLIVYLSSTDVGLEGLIYKLIFCLSFLLLIVSIIIGIIKNKKCDDAIVKTNIIPLLITIIPIILASFIMFSEKKNLNNSDIILKYNYQEGIIISNDYYYGINNKEVKCLIFGDAGIKKYAKYPLESREIVRYRIKIENDGSNYEVDSYDDTELKEYNKEIVDKILKDAINNHNDGEKITKVNVAKIDGYNYYIITQVSNNGVIDNLVNCLVYNNDKYIRTISLHGNLEKAFVVKK